LWVPSGGVSVARVMMCAVQQQCQRFLADGSRCTNKTLHADGWCREPGCPGFQRPSREWAPETFGSAKGTPKRIAKTGHVPLAVTVDDVLDVRVTTRALDAFRFHHGGGIKEAEVQLRAMLEDFILRSARTVTDNEYVLLAREGFTLTLSPKMTAVVGYSTVHRERTWEQVKAGVRSRISKKDRVQPPHEPVPPQPDGPPVTLEEFPSAVDTEKIALTARLRISYGKIARYDADWDEEFDTSIRNAFAAALPTGAVAHRDDGLFEVTAHGLVWLVSAGAGVLIGVKRERRTTDDVQ
jgi:hypothetical protein